MPLQQARRIVLIIRRIAPGAWCASGIAAACVLAFPWPIKMLFANPPAIFAEGAFHRLVRSAA